MALRPSRLTRLTALATALAASCGPGPTQGQPDCADSAPDLEPPEVVDVQESAPAAPSAATTASSGQSPPAAAGQGAPSADDGWCPAARVVPRPDRRIYATWQSFPLTGEEHGIEGALRVLEDSRFTRRGAVRNGTHPALAPCDALPARLEVLDEAGGVVQEETFRPQTDLVPYRIAAGETLYVARELVYCIASCWCGDDLSFWQVRQGRLAPLRSVHGNGRPGVVRGVTLGCYESGGVERSSAGALEVVIRRTTTRGSSAVASTERHGWNGSEWSGSWVERQIPW